MNKAPIVAVATLAALAAPSAAIAAPTPQAGVIQQTGITVEPTDEFAGNYVPKRNSLVLESTRLTGTAESFEYSCKVPAYYAGHRVAAYIERPDGNTERIAATVALSRSAFDFSFEIDISGYALVTVAVELFEEIEVDSAHFYTQYDPKLLTDLYRRFSESTAVTNFTADDGSISATVVTTGIGDAIAHENAPVIDAVDKVDGRSEFREYADGYMYPLEGGMCLGSFRYCFDREKAAGEDTEPTAGFAFSVDEKYAGWSAFVYLDTYDYHENADSVVHEVTVSEDGTFTVPYASVGQHHDSLEFARFNNWVSDDYVSGVVTVTLEPPNVTETGAIVDFNGWPQTSVGQGGARFTVVSSDLSVSITSIGNTMYNRPNGYEFPEEGGIEAGAFRINLQPFGDVGDSGLITFRIDLGAEYSGRKATVYSDGPTEETPYRKRTYDIGSDGVIAITERMTVDEPNNLPYAYSICYTYGINIEPADTAPLAGATVSAIPDQTWSGTPVTPKPTVILDGKVLTEGTDYELSYENNDKPGTAAVVVTGKGAYSGTVRVEFQIVEKGGEPSGPSDPTDPDTPDTPDDPEKPAPAFPDVTEDAWYFEAVTRAAELGVMNGYSGSDRFGPLDWLTREQAAAVMFNYLGDNDLAAPPAPQKDVLNDWYTDAVNWAVAEGVMGGYAGTDLFGIGQTLTREEFCAVIANAAGADLEAADTSVLGRFADGAAVSAWARPAVAWAVEAGIMNGVELDNGSRALQATRGLVRAEMAAMTVSAIDAGVLG